MTYLTVQDIAERTQLSLDSVYRAITNGHLQAYKPAGTYRVHPKDFEGWMEACRLKIERRGRATKLDTYADVIPIR